MVSILCTYLYAYAVSRSRLFHSLNTLHVHSARELGAFRRLTPFLCELSPPTKSYEDIVSQHPSVCPVHSNSIEKDVHSFGCYEGALTTQQDLFCFHHVPTFPHVCMRFLSSDQYLGTQHVNLYQALCWTLG